MQIRDLPYPDPGDPDVRSGPRFLYWLGRNQLGGQLKALGWGLLHSAGHRRAPGLASASPSRPSSTAPAHALALAGGADRGSAASLIAVGDTMLHRTAVTNWITAAARVQQLLARKTAELGSALTRRVAAGEVVAVSTGDVEKIGWFVEALSRFAGRRRRRSSWSASAWSSTSPPSASSWPSACRCWPSPCCRCSPAPPGAPTCSARRRARPPSWPPTPSPDCGCCAASAARSCSSAATAAPPRRSARPPCAAPGCGR